MTITPPTAIPAMAPVDSEPGVLPGILGIVVTVGETDTGDETGDLSSDKILTTYIILKQ